MSKTDELDLKRGEIFRGRQRKLAFIALENNGKAVYEIRDKINQNLTDKGKTLTLREVSRALKWLAENDIAVCLNPKDRKILGKTNIMYKISLIGNKIKQIS